MSYQHSKVINILSTTAIRGRKGHGPSSSAKAALWSWTRSLRRVYGKSIQVMEIMPSQTVMANFGKNPGVAEDAARKIFHDERRGKEMVMIPPGRVRLHLFSETLSDWMWYRLFGQ